MSADAADAVEPGGSWEDSPWKTRWERYPKLSQEVLKDLCDREELGIKTWYVQMLCRRMLWNQVAVWTTLVGNYYDTHTNPMILQASIPGHP